MLGKKNSKCVKGSELTFFFDNKTFKRECRHKKLRKEKEETKAE
jgi:hypothetical protein